MNRRIRQSGEEPKVWQKAGWSREPRNGREWRMLKAGEPEPKIQEKDLRWSRPFKCRKCGSKQFKVHASGAKKPVRRCVPCRAKYIREYYRKNKKKYRKYTYRHKQQVDDLVVEMEEGWVTVPFSFLLRKGGMPLLQFLEEGRVVVEYMGAPAFCIVTLEDGRKLK